MNPSTSAHPNRGRAPDSNEILFHALDLNESTEQLQADLKAAVDEVRRMTAPLEGADQHLRTMASHLERTSVPEEVKRVGKMGQEVMASFKEQATGLATATASFKKEAVEATKSLHAELHILSRSSWQRTGLTMLTLLCCVGLVVWSIRSPGPLAGVNAVSTANGVWVPILELDKKCDAKGKACISYGLVRRLK